MLKDRLNLNDLLPFGADTDEIDRTRNKFLQSGNILASLWRQLLILSNVTGRNLPPGQFLVDRLTMT